MAITYRIEKKSERERFHSLFDKHTRGRAILFQGLRLNIGELFVDSIHSPTTGIFSLEPVHFVAGNPDTDTAIEFLETVQPVQFVFVPDDYWVKRIFKSWKNRTKPHKRTRLDETSLELDHLRRLQDELPSGFEIGSIEDSHLDQIPTEYLTQIKNLFGSRKKFLEEDFGKAITSEKELASIAYPAFPYIDAFEVQVITLDSPEFRRKGLATVACAAMMIDAIEHGVIPHWDAANETSVALAKKLGYSNPDPYYAYFKIPYKK